MLQRLFRFIPVVLACLGIPAYAAHAAEMDGMAMPAPFVAVARATVTDAVDVKRYTGHISTTSSVDLVARVSGELLRVGFEEGDLVTEGQVLYELDDTRYQAEVKNAEARIAESEAKLAYARQRHDRAKNLYDSRADTREAFDSAESEFKAFQAALLAAEAQLISVRDDLKNTRIIAPITGKIGVTAYTRGNYLTPNSGVIATIVQVDPLRVSFAMSNKDYLALFGSEAELKARSLIQLRLADGSVYEHEGRIKFLDNQASQKTDAIRVFAEFDNPDGKLVPGSAVTVLLARRNGGTHTAVMPSAVMHDAGSAYVYVLGDDNQAERRDIVLGFATGGLQTVLSGLEPGEIVVVDGTHKVVPGSPIEPDYVDAALAEGREG
ncbi:MAG: efflux RND transporter periplasmic adaptor subunit [Planctomycetaceae bacterium]|nr:efflux RND transporter periplasmic adaptor subunit [Planctomycetaceae bacterium]